MLPTKPKIFEPTNAASSITVFGYLLLGTALQPILLLPGAKAGRGQAKSQGKHAEIRQSTYQNEGNSAR